MAERKYTSRGYTLQSPGRLELADIQESTRLSQNIISKVDQLTQFAFGKAKSKAEARGKQYGAENKPTLEQLNDAIELGLDPNDLLAKPGTFAGDAARSTQVKLLKQDLIVDINNQLATIENVIEQNPNVDVGELQSQVNAMIDGYYNVLAQMDVDEAVAFRASASTSGYQVLKKANDIAFKAHKEKHQATSQQVMIDTADQVHNLLKDEDMDINSFRDLLLEKKYQANEYFKQEPSTLSKNYTDFDEKISDVIKNHIAHKIEEEGSEMDFINGIPSEYDDYLDLQNINNDDMRKQIFEIATDISAKKQQLINAKKTIENDQRADYKNDAYIQLIKEEITPDEYIEKSKDKETGFNLTPEEIKQAYNYNADLTGDDVYKQEALNTAILAGGASRFQLKQMFDSGYINQKIYQEGLKTYREMTTKNTAQKNIIKGLFKIPDTVTLELLDNKVLRDLAFQAMAEYDRQSQIAALDLEATFNPNKVAEQIGKEFKNRYVNEKIIELRDMFIQDNKRKPISINLSKIYDMTDDEIMSLKYVNGEPISKSKAQDIIMQRDVMIRIRDEALDPGL